jgi:hypothetical protein
MKLPTLAEVRKAYAAFAAAVVVMIGAGLITGDAQAWISGAVAAVAAGLATYGVNANAVPPTQPVAPSGVVYDDRPDAPDDAVTMQVVEDEK